MTNYEKLCDCVAIYAAGNNYKFYDALVVAGINEVVNRRVFYPNDETLVNMAVSLLPPQRNRSIVQTCEDMPGWFHARFANWDAAYWIFCPANCTGTVSMNPDWVKCSGSEASLSHAFAWLEKNYE